MTTKRAAVPKVSGAMGTPQDIALVQQRLEPMLKNQQANLAEQERLGKELLRAQQEEAKAIADRDIAVREAEVQALEEGAQAERRLVGEYQQKIEKNPFPTFKPSQEDLTTYAQLGSMIATLGLMIGGAGKASSKIAIGAMTGMLNGWRQGRKDLWDREAKTFEKELQKIKLEHESIKKDLEMGLKLAATDREASRARLMAAKWKSGAGSINEANLNTGKAQLALDMTKKSGELLMNIDKTVQDFASRERAARDAAEQSRLQREAMIEAVRIRAAAKGEAGLLKPGAEVTKNYLGQNALSNDMKDIANNLKDPKFRKLIDDYRIESFASEEMGKLAAQIANDQIPSELRKFLTKVRSVRNNVYLITSGKAVTGGEALRNYGVVAQPGDSAAFMADKVDSMINQIDRTIGQYQKLYGLPAIDAESIKQFRSAEKDGAFDVRQIPVQDVQSDQMESAARSAFGSYEPNIYDYRRDPQTGRMQRAKKE